MSHSIYWLLAIFIFCDPNGKVATGILNCLLARQLCFEDASCSAILEIIPRVCGPELVACSTVTVTKCQAALRTLQAFPFFKPTCLCREPHVDPECNSFRDFLFDHPCVFVLKKEKDPYPVDALPTCNHALSVCQQEKKCIKLYDDFKLHCKVRDNKCRMEDRVLCHDSWTNLKKSPMFGCICPNNHMKKRCDRIFSMVNHNPCVVNAHFGNNAPFDYGLDGAAVENPLVDGANGLDAHADHDFASISVYKNKALAIPVTAPSASSSSANGNANINSNVYAEDLDAVLPAQQQKHQSSTDSSSRSSNSNGTTEIGDTVKIIFQSTCHLAMESCNGNYNCRMALAPILHHCDISRCNRNSCMEALQAFYRKPSFPWNIEIAFCLCKKTDNKYDSCMVAQERLHPVCAQRIDGVPQPTCLSLAEACRENNECRARLEYYEQSCAVDSVTKKCAGKPSECRLAMLGILGTDLRTGCACKGTDMSQLYECLGWQRLLWVNPCVVESQKDFHLKKALELSFHTSSTTISTFRTTQAARTTTTKLITQPTPPEKMSYTLPQQVTSSAPAMITTTTMRPTTTTVTTTVFVPTTTTTTTTTTPSTTTMTTTTTTTTTMATTTLPPKYCVVQRPHFPDQYIREGSLKRIYHEDEFECSDVCQCEIGEKLACKTICIDRMPCKTEFAFYNHAAPAYQAYRGRCLCYSGRFICMKPAPSEYTLPQGVFLFLGYSEVDERELNKNHTKIIIQDVVHALQEFILNEATNGTLCSLELFNITRENVIIAGKLSPEVDYTMLSPMESLVKEKEECAELLETISERINGRNPDFASHLLLSVFKMAEVEIVQIEANSANSHLLPALRSIYFLYSSFIALLTNFIVKQNAIS